MKRALGLVGVGLVAVLLSLTEATPPPVAVAGFASAIESFDGLALGRYRTLPITEIGGAPVTISGVHGPLEVIPETRDGYSGNLVAPGRGRNAYIFVEFEPAVVGTFLTLCGEGATATIYMDHYPTGFSLEIRTPPDGSCISQGLSGTQGLHEVVAVVVDGLLDSLGVVTAD